MLNLEEDLFNNFYEFFTAAIVSFEQQTYNVNESNEKVQVVLVLSNPSSTDIIIEVVNTDGSAIGK